MGPSPVINAAQWLFKRLERLKVTVYLSCIKGMNNVIRLIKVLMYWNVTPRFYMISSWIDTPVCENETFLDKYYCISLFIDCIFRYACYMLATCHSGQVLFFLSLYHSSIDDISFMITLIIERKAWSRCLPTSICTLLSCSNFFHDGKTDEKPWMFVLLRKIHGLSNTSFWCATETILLTISPESL